MVDAINSLKAHNVTPSPVSLKIMGCSLAPVACTGGLIQGASPTTTTYSMGAFPNTNGSDNGVGKIDYKINNQHSLNAMVFIGDYLAIGADHPILNANWQNGNPISSKTVTSNWIWTASSRLLDDFRFGYNYASAPLGSWRGRPSGFTQPTFNFQDNLSYLFGKHSLKFGGEFAHIKVDVDNHDTRGRIQFKAKQAFTGSTPLDDFFAGKPTRAVQLVGPPERIINWTSPGALLNKRSAACHVRLATWSLATAVGRTHKEQVSVVRGGSAGRFE